MSTVTGSRILDRIFFFGILALMGFATPRIIVYYRVMATKISVVAITADGTRIPLETPESLQGGGRGIRKTERRIRSFAKTPAARALTPPGGRLEWSLHYSMNTARFARFSRVRIVDTEVSNEN